MAIFVWTSEVISHRTREHYLRSVLRQEVSFFDKVGAGEVSTCITNNMLLLQDAIGEKLPLCVTHLCTFVAGFAVAFTKSWKLTLVLMCVFPMIAIAGAVMGVLAGRFQVQILAIYGNAGTVAEEAISSARTVTAFNAQDKVSARYNIKLADARRMGIKKSVAVGMGLGSLFFFIYAA